VCTFFFPDYSEDRVGQWLNADLANTLGNLLLRVTSRKLHPWGPGVAFSWELFPLGDSEGREMETGVRATGEDSSLMKNLINLPGTYIQITSAFLHRLITL